MAGADRREKYCVNTGEGSWQELIEGRSIVLTQRRDLGRS